MLSLLSKYRYLVNKLVKHRSCRITIHYSQYCTVAFCYVHKYELSYMCLGHDIKLYPHRVKLYWIVYGIWLSIDEGANVIISKYVIRLDNWLLRLCNWSVFTVYCVTLLSCNVVNMHCISLAILSRMILFPSPAVGTNLPFCVDVPLKNQPTNQVVSWLLLLFWMCCFVLYLVWCSLHSRLFGLQSSSFLLLDCTS